MRYAKPGDGTPVRYGRAEDGPFLLRVTLGDMALEDAFTATLPEQWRRITLRDLMVRLFSETDDSRSESAALDLRANPDASEMQDALGDLVAAWTEARCSLRLSLNYGGEVAPESAVETTLGMESGGGPGGTPGAALDLVIEQTWRPIDYAVERGFAASRVELLDWMRDCLKLVAAARDGSIGDEGRRRLDGYLDEAASVAAQYGVFGDVLHDSECRAAEFGTGRGADLMSQIVEAEGIDPVRAVFLLMVAAAIHDESQLDIPTCADDAFYDWLLTPAVDRDQVATVWLDDIVEAGHAYTEQEAGEAEAAAAVYGLRRRSKGRTRRYPRSRSSGSAPR